MAKSSNISLNIQANTQKALNQFKSFSSNLQNKFLISGLQLDFVRNALSSINREFERYAGGGGLTEAVQTQQLTRSLQSSLSIIQGYSVEVSKSLSENIGLALSKINTQVGGNKSDIIAFTNEVSTAINEQVALGLTGTKNIVAANEQLFSLMQRLKLGYGESAEEISGNFKKVLLNQMSIDELLESVQGKTKDLFLAAAYQSGGQLGNMAGVNRGLFFKKVQELTNQFLPSTDELVKTNPQAILGKLLNTLFDDRVGIFGALRQIKLPGGGSTTILKEGAELLNALFGEKGLLLTLMREVGRAFGMKDVDDAGLLVVNLIDFFTSIVENLTRALQTPTIRALLKNVANIITKIGDFIGDVVKSFGDKGTIGEEQIKKLGDALASALELFAQVLSVALNKLAPKIGDAILVSIVGMLKGLGQFITGGNPFGAVLGGGLLGFGALKGFSMFSENKESRERNQLSAITEANKVESKEINAELKQNKNKLKQINNRLNVLEKIEKLTEEEGKEYLDLVEKKNNLTSNINAQNQRQLDISTQNAESERRSLALNKQKEARQRLMMRLAVGATALTAGGTEFAAGIAGGESWQRSLAKGGLVGAGALTGLIPVIGPFIAPIATTLAFGFADKFADALGFTKYNGNFPTAANGMFNAMNKESLMSGNKGLVIANQDEIIAPPHRLAQLAGMMTNMSGSNKAQYILVDKFKSYQDDQKKQMRELIKETQLGNTLKRQSGGGAPQAANITNNVTNAKLDKDSFPQSFWPSLTETFKEGFLSILRNGVAAAGNVGDFLKNLLGITPRAAGNIPSNFFAMYKSEMNAYGGKPVLANDKELIISPTNFSTFASLLKQTSQGGQGATINNEININVQSSGGEVDTNRIAMAVMKAIDTKYKEVYNSLGYV